MAEIHVQPRKKRTHGWVWLLLLLVVVAAVVYFLWANGSLSFSAAVTDTLTRVASAAPTLVFPDSGGLHGTA